MDQKLTDELRVRIDPEHRRMIQDLMEAHDRSSQSDLVRALIRQDWRAKFGGQPTTPQQTTPQQ